MRGEEQPPEVFEALARHDDAPADARKAAARALAASILTDAARTSARIVRRATVDARSEGQAEAGEFLATLEDALADAEQALGEWARGH